MNKILDSLQEKYSDLDVTTIDLFHHEVPAMAGDRIEAKYIIMRGGEIQQDMKMTWSEIEGTIAGFMRADMYLMSVPMWNFSVPYAFKFYLDTIVQPGYLFKYNADGSVKGMGSGKVIVVKTCGNDYSQNSPINQMDFHEPYIQTVLGFCGFTDVRFVRAYGMDLGPAIREASIQEAIENQVPSLLRELEFVMT